MDKTRLLKKTELFAKKIHSGEGTGHDWWHIFSVKRNVERLAEKEGGDLFIMTMAALLHDVDDPKLAGGNLNREPRRARAWLARKKLPQDLIGQICDIIGQVSFKGAGVDVRPKILEAKIVQDADRLEALGAIGIARTFAVGGKFNRPLFDPAVKPRLHRTQGEYEKRFCRGTTVNHFYEKILLLKNRMNTKTGKMMAKTRHDFVLEYLKEFFKEWQGKG